MDTTSTAGNSAPVSSSDPSASSSTGPQASAEYRLSSNLTSKRDKAAPIKGPEDGDTCRICRGEGSVDEPLFYPCKCSGSIKFVHQECLMEWLSHSQKKHCELCKTSFRFTKLYDSSMPTHLPTLVFVRKAALHILQALVLWLRAFLVAGVWLVWLPWSMRFVWWGLFWIADGGWTRDFQKLRSGLDADSALRPFTRSPHRNATSPVAVAPTSPLSALTRIPSILFRVTRATLYSPIAVIKQAFGRFASSKPSSEPFTNATTPALNGTSAAAATSDQESLLSYVSFFRNLTPNPAVNKFVIDILEGLIITLAVVTAVILVFLIREWVVQQQPALNLAGIADDDDAPAEAAAPAAVPQGDEEQVDGDTEQAVNSELAAQSTQSAPTQESAEAQDVSLEKVQHLAQQLREHGPFIKSVINGDMQFSTERLETSREFIRQASSMMQALDKVQKRAADSGDSVGSQDAQVKMNLLKDSLTYFPWWRDEGQPSRAATSAVGESSNMGAQNPTGAESGQSSRDGFHSSAFAHGSSLTPTTTPTSESRSYANVLSQDRPSMPDRVRSSLATNIQRDLQEATEPSTTSTDAPRSIGSSNSDDSHSAWQHISATDTESLDQISPSQLPERRDSLNDQIPRLKRKQKADQLSVGFADQADPIPGYSRPEAKEQDEASLSSDTESPSSIVDLSAARVIPQSVERRIEDPALGSPYSTQPVTSDGPEPLQPIETSPAAELDIDSPLEGGSQDTQGQYEGHNPETGDSYDGIEVQDTATPDRSLKEKILDWLFDDPILAGAPAGRDQEGGRNDEHVVEDLANEAPFVPFVEARPQNRPRENDDEQPNQNPEPIAEAVQAGANPNDADAGDDAEDLEGVFELIGMQGPLTGVFQNAVFCAVFIAATVTSAVWFPYLWGKLILLVLANPVQMVVAFPIQTISGATNFVIDLTLFGFGTALFWLDFLFRGLLKPVAWVLPVIRPMTDSKKLASLIIHVVDSAVTRMSSTIFAIGRSSQDPHSYISLSSLVALRVVQNKFQLLMAKASNVIAAGINLVNSARSATVTWDDCTQFIDSSSEFAARVVNQLLALLSKLLSSVKSGEVSLTLNHTAKPVLTEAQLVGWTPTDRLVAVAVGYMCFALAGALYIRRGAPFSTSQQGKKIERVITEMLQQSGGVLKVILIISIEMILFPLYCGVLLDVAMLPLFQSTFESRVNFMITAPWTAAFIHWFLGTCYMFHFALFVSMCRKIFRSGVLYFIRDPDDPTFHPVRDVLDRSVSSQLRKIGFSALVYGALVIVCMGSVVWTVALCVRDLFPVRWASNSPFLGFPVDLLLYNLFAPLALQFFRPSKTLQRLYERWFRFCAIRLQLTEFLFGDDKKSGTVNERNAQTNRDINGRFVRAPASDQVRIPKGHRVFLEVDKENRRLDGLEDKEEGVHGKSNPHFTTVWIPPWYRLRIVVFAFCIWALTAFLGLSVTVVPLLIGRNILNLFLDNAAKINDIYAFAIGLFTIAAIGVAIFKIRRYWKEAERSKLFGHSYLSSVSNSILGFAIRACRVLYTYSSLLILVPALIALIIEFYFIMPLHTYTKISQSSTGQESAATTKPMTHTVFFLQDCTLGLLYLRVFLRFLLWNPNSRPALALHAIVANGWLNPNVRIATRCFILPFTTLTVLALCIPSGLAYVTSKVLPLLLSQLSHSDAAPSGLSRLMYAASALDPSALRVYLMRFSYPFFLFLAAVAWIIVALGKAAGRWKARIKDEVYLIGERLHNFAERRPPPVPSRRVAGN